MFGLISKRKLGKELARVYMSEEPASRNGTKEERLRAWEAQSSLNYIFSKFFTEKERVKYLKEVEM